MKYLVTGGAGFIGSHLIDNLVSKGYDIICIDDLSSGQLTNIFTLDKIKLINKAVQETSIEEISGINGIFHLAAQASVPKSIIEFYNSSSNNLLSTLKVWNWANKINIPVVYASSSAVYGNLPVGDDTIDNFDILSPYAQDKLTMEHYAKMTWKVYKTSSIGLRFFNVYGPKQDPNNPYSGVISIFINNLLKSLPITVNGGYQTRDFIYVSDIVDVLLRSMDILKENKICEVFNVGTGKSITIDLLLSSLIEITNLKASVKYVPLPEGDPERSEGKCEKLNKITELSLESFVPINQGLAKTIDYYKKNK